jgi:hypothetical protein
MMQNKQKNYFVLCLIIILSGFIHLWNPVGFPDVFFDEGVYMRRAMHVLSGQGPQEAFFHDHPFFGQLFLGGFLFATGFPNSLNISSEPNSLQLLYLMPRILMGLLATLDTFLTYKIAQKRYNSRIALITAALFAVMPFTWILRRILLDSILLPFLLSSILTALYMKDSENKKALALYSGILLGLAIFTKIPVFSLIPFIAGIIYWYGGKNLKIVGLWFIPVFLIPLIWPIQAIDAGQFDLWIKDVLWQTQRTSGGIVGIAGMFFLIDPVLFILGIAGFIFAARKKDYFILSWCIPFILFLSLIGYAQYFHWIPILPVFCIAAAKLIYELPQGIKKEGLKKGLPLIITSLILAFGFASTTLLISTNMSNAQFETMSYVLKNVSDSDTTTLASPTYSWIFHDVFEKKNVLTDYSLALFEPISTSKILLVADPHFLFDINRGPQLVEIYNKTVAIVAFDGNVRTYDTSKYPYSNLSFNYEGSHIEIRMAN